MFISTHVIEDSCRHGRIVSLQWLALLIGIPLFAAAFAYPTYNFNTPTGLIEISRQTGLPFLGAECLIIFFAIFTGRDLKGIWQSLPRHIIIASKIWMLCFWWSSVFVSVNPSYAVLFCVGWFLQPLFAISLYATLGTINWVKIDIFTIAISAILATFCLLIAFRFIFHPDPADVPGGAIIWQAAIPGFLSVRLFGAFCGAFLACFVALAMTDDEVPHPYRYIAISLLTGMTVWSGTRAAVLGFVAAIIIVFLLGSRPKWSTLVSLVSSGLLGALLGVLLIPYGDMAFMLYVVGDGQSADAASGGRFAIWSAVWNTILNSPWIGYGAGASAWTLPSTIFPHIQPHNVILEYLQSWGLVGALPCFWVLGFATIRAHQVALRHQLAIPFIAMLDSLLIMSMFDGMLHFAQHMMLIMISFAIIFAVKNQATFQFNKTVR
jgi:exopolysaccharide production protein ExoQ